jgi:uncharacterized protein (TIGR00369 family)
MVDGRRPHPAHSSILGVRIAEVDVGDVTLLWAPGGALKNPAGSVHGGFISGVLDMAAGLAAASAREVFTHHFTLEIHVDFLTPVRTGHEHRVVGTVLRTGRSSSLAYAWVYDGSSTLAQARATFVPDRNRADDRSVESVPRG